MLSKLEIENIALVERVTLAFNGGLSVLTGETGAGKSVIVTALSLALGERADREYIRFKCDTGSVTAYFDISRMSLDYKKEFAGYLNGDELIVYREIARDGNSKAKINGNAVTLTQLKAITAPMAEILGQHANQMLMNEDNHLDFLDRFAALDDLKQTVAEKYQRWRKTAEELARLVSRRDQLVKEKELLLFQKQEIERANISVGEEEQLLNERKRLDSARALMTSAALVKDIIENEENSVISLLTLAQRELDKMARMDDRVEKKIEELANISYQVEELRGFIEQYGSSIEDNPARIEEINVRLDEIYGLKKKYGGSEAAIFESLRLINNRLADSPPDVDEYIENLTRNNRKQFEEYGEDALALSDTRKKAATYLQKLVVKELKELAIDNSSFEFEFLYEDDPSGVIINGRAVKPGPNGLEKGRIMFSANPGEPLKSLVKTASGGEVSRVLLALKSAEKRSTKAGRSLLVFDEVDAGIGGRTAIEVGKKLKKLSVDNQLLVITHLHQIAREADHHFVAGKAVGKDRRAVILVTELDAAGIQKELGRMVALPL